MSFVLANTVAAALLALAVMAIGRWGKPSPAVMHGLWLFVVLKLVTPPLFEVPVAFGGCDVAAVVAAPAADASPLAAEPPAASAAPVELPTFPVDAVVTAHALPIVAAPALPIVAAPALQPESSETSLSPWLVAWLGSAAVMLAVLLVAGARARRRQRLLAPVRGALQREIAELAARIGVRVPRVQDDPSAPSPYVWTIGPARLIVPAAALQRCPARGRAAVLAHELAHLRRRDHHIARLELVLMALLWWHPLFWFARAQMRLQAELACDAIAVRTVPGANLDYATLLVEAAARPPSTGPAAVVLASRPSARAAFERRLTMILNDSLPRRASRAWIVPFAGLTFGLFSLPVRAVAQEPEPQEPVRIEIRVNGERVEGLSPAQQRALLEALQGPKGEKQARAASRARKTEIQDDAEGQGVGAQVRAALTEGLREAREEIRNDPDLKELGITDEVTKLLDGIANGEGFESGMDDLLRAALKGAGRMALREIEQDEDLKQLGLTKGVSRLVQGMLDDPHGLQMLSHLARGAMQQALGEAKQELRSDADLRRLGITGDVERLIDTVVSGGDFEGAIERLVEKATAAAGEEMQRAAGEAGDAKPGKGRAATRAELERELERARAELDRARAELEKLERAQLRRMR